VVDYPEKVLTECVALGRSVRDNFTVKVRASAMTEYSFGFDFIKVLVRS
jgi:hypothetical protein